MFKRDKREQQAKAEVLGQIERSRERARELTAKAGRDLGMDVDALMREGMQTLSGGGQQQLMAYAARAVRLTQAGVEMSAGVRGVSLGEPSAMQGGLPARIELTVEPPDAAAYEVAVEQVLHESMASALETGARVTVKVDPDDPANVMVWGTQPPAPAAAPDERLAKLEQLRASGVLSDEEFEQQRTKLRGR